MKDYVKRMIQEKEDLIGKIKRADKAVRENPYGMTDEQKELLNKQLKPMGEYLDILSQRIEVENERH